MTELRLILLVAGALIIGGVYLYSRRSSGKADADRDDALPEMRHRHEAGLDEDLDDLPPLNAADDPAEPFHEVDDPPERRRPAVPAAEKIIALNILPSSPEGRFLGSDLLDIFDRAGLEYGRFDVFHRILETPEGPQSVFSVASATEPGSFDVTVMGDQSFKGLSLFMLLPGPQRGVDAFADMLATARRIAQQLDADVRDRNRSTLTKQTAHHIREEIIAFEHSLQQGY